MKKTHPFKAEMSQLMDLVINSLYQNRDVFLRELIANAADACERLRFAAISDAKLSQGQDETRIRISIDKEKKSIAFDDNGIGMDEQDVIGNLGQVASSGTRRFLEQMSQADGAGKAGAANADAASGGAGKAGAANAGAGNGDAGNGDADKSGSFDQFIGKFGVGFYAAFLVADRVDVYTRKAGDSADKGVHFSTDGRSEYTLEQAIRPVSGTEVVLHIKDDCTDYLDNYRLTELAKKYSGHISFPLHLPAADDAIVAAGADEKDKSQSGGYQIINPAPALWLRAAKDITANEYKEFFRSANHSLDDPMSWLHCKLEGAAEYRALLYVPSFAPPQLLQQDFHGQVKLYIRRVFVTLEHKLLPEWLRFMVGVIEAPNLAMNVSREALQNDKSIRLIRKSLTKKVVDHFAKLAKDDDAAWQGIHDKYAIPIKQGVITEHDHRDTLTGLLRFASTRADASTSLDDYIARAPAEQKRIYYLTAPDMLTAKASPYLETMNRRNIEVLLCTDPVDEWMIAQLGQYRDSTFEAVHKGEFSAPELDQTGDEVKEESADSADACLDLIRRTRLALEKRINTVRATKRLHESPACLVSTGDDLSLHTKDALRLHGHQVNPMLPDLEINPDHPFIQGLDKTQDEEEFKRLVEVLYDVCALSAVGRLDNPVESARRITQILSERFAPVQPAKVEATVQPAELKS
ncbi:MAG: molecular chaperone HtpG [Proteobacteria bacterium]|nr:molecular chaperone HtpG [Pseudomonadota bacterium]